VSWGRYDDNYCDWPLWEHVSFAARWHYQALVQTCCRLEQWDGRLTLTVARRVSDVGHADACHDELAAVDLVKVDGGQLVLLRIDEHVPPAPAQIAADPERDRARQLDADAPAGCCGAGQAAGLLRAGAGCRRWR
jgi:hypothetical protein